MECSRDLDQPLLEHLFGPTLLQPQFLPNLMRLKEFGCVEKRNSTPKSPAFFHRVFAHLPLEFSRIAPAASAR